MFNQDYRLIRVLSNTFRNTAKEYSWINAVTACTYDYSIVVFCFLNNSIADRVVGNNFALRIETVSFRYPCYGLI